MELTPIKIIITVNSVPNKMFKKRFIFGPRTTDSATIREGIAKSIDATNSFVGLSRMFSPVIKLLILSGVYSSK